jgi:hypothetical protein
VPGVEYAFGELRPALVRDGDVPADQLRRSLLQNTELRVALNRAWPLIEA